MAPVSKAPPTPWVLRNQPMPKAPPPGLRMGHDPWLLAFEQPEPDFIKCAWPLCEKKARWRGYCSKCGWKRQEIENDQNACVSSFTVPAVVLTPGPRCYVDHCDLAASYRGYCDYHSWQEYPN